jgi:hypothetical protein
MPPGSAARMLGTLHDLIAKLNKSLEQPREDS